MATNKVIINGATELDLTGDTATAADVAAGKTFHLASGAAAVGTATPGCEYWTAEGEFDDDHTATASAHYNPPSEAYRTWSVTLADGTTDNAYEPGETYDITIVDTDAGTGDDTTYNVQIMTPTLAEIAEGSGGAGKTVDIGTDGATLTLYASAPAATGGGYDWDAATITLSYRGQTLATYAEAQAEVEKYPTSAVHVHHDGVLVPADGYTFDVAKFVESAEGVAY